MIFQNNKSPSPIWQGATLQINLTQHTLNTNHDLHPKVRK
jgi:hypothetical protein